MCFSGAVKYTKQKTRKTTKYKYYKGLYVVLWSKSVNYEKYTHMVRESIQKIRNPIIFIEITKKDQASPFYRCNAWSYWL